MSFVARMWAREPVVCFSIALGTVGLAMPLLIPRELGMHNDSRARQERILSSEERARKAMIAIGKCIHLLLSLIRNF